MFLRSPEPDATRSPTGCSRAPISTRPRTRRSASGSRSCTTTLVRNKLAAFDGVADAAGRGATPAPTASCASRSTAEQEGELLLAVNDASARPWPRSAGEDPEPSMLADWLLDLIAELSELQLAELPEVDRRRRRATARTRSRIDRARSVRDPLSGRLA